MNICLVIISDGWGGGETVVYELAKCLRDKGENVSIILNQEILKFYEILSGITIFNIGSVYNHEDLINQILNKNIKINRWCNINAFPWSLLNELSRLVYFKKIEKQIMQFIIENKIDVIHSHLDYSHLLISCFKNPKNVWIGTVHGGGLPSVLNNNSIRSVLSLEKMKVKMLKQAYCEMDMITFVSHWLLDTYKDVIPLDNKNEIIFNGIDLLDIQKYSTENCYSKEQFNLLFPGGARAVKNPEVMIRALLKVKNIIPNIHLYIAGNVPHDHNIRIMVRDLEIDGNISFTGHLSPQKYRSLLSLVDILVMPSKTEGLPISLLEGMAMGKSIVASNRGGIPELITNRINGILVEPDSDEVADAILCLYKNDGLRKEIENNNLQGIANFEWNLIVDKYIGVYRKTLCEIKK